MIFNFDRHIWCKKSSSTFLSLSIFPLPLLPSTYITYSLCVFLSIHLQNSLLKDRVSWLETCECRPSCSDETGRVYGNGETWTKDGCTMCQCIVSYGCLPYLYITSTLQSFHLLIDLYFHMCKLSFLYTHVYTTFHVFMTSCLHFHIYCISVDNSI